MARDYTTIPITLTHSADTDKKCCKRVSDDLNNQTLSVTLSTNHPEANLLGVTLPLQKLPELFEEKIV